MRPDFIEIVAFGASLGLNVHIDSNGTMIDEVVGAIPDGADVTIIFSLITLTPTSTTCARGPGSHAGVTRPRGFCGTASIDKCRNHSVVGSHNVDVRTDG